MFDIPFLPGLLALPLVGALCVSLLPAHNGYTVKTVALSFSCLTFLLSLFLWIGFHDGIADFQYASEFSWGTLTLHFGVDGISLFFLLLTTLLVPLCLLTGWASVQHSVKEYCILFLLMETVMLGVFCILDVLFFYIFFEAVLLPMYLIIGIWGSRERRIKAAYTFFLYTLLGSVFMLLGLLALYLEAGTTDLHILLTTPLSEKRQIILWIAFFASFAVKVPMLPVHIWLPEAHVEAPTAGSVVLAGILLKLGTYGFLRFSLPLFPYASLYFTPFIFVLSVIGILYASCTTLRQVDLKKIIAYSSVAHMNFVTLGLFSGTLQGIEGAIMLMLSHGFVSSALFLCIGVLYDRYKTRLLKYYGGCIHTMPLFAVLFLFFTLGNLSLPGTSAFVGEFMLLTGVYQTNTFICFLAALGMILGAAYSLWLYNRVVFGHMKMSHSFSSSDVNRREFWIFFPLIVCTLWMGVFPEVFLDSIHSSVSWYL
uniref:NADH-ubiquinone oxidoreductase chain 4 n=1 Tax=Prasinococcus sp. CCMP1194 TaxID=110672 RepID=A0A650AKT5_9VIRI|nr:NADH dehydrogenase subunit 4 [Prasinococcus sp. CCMP1194]